MKNILLAKIGLFFITSLLSQDKLYEDFDPAKFNDQSANITNDWMPLKPGMRYVYAGTTFDDEENISLPHRVVIHVTGLTKVINNIKSRVTYDLDFEQGELVEAELAFFAQDVDGNVWRMGEFPAEYDEGDIVEAPCWLSGIDGAVSGISMRAHPWLGMGSYSQGWAPDVNFTDRGEITQLGLRICVPTGCYDNVLEISETSMEEPDAAQLKYWAEQVGNIQVGYKGDDPSKEMLQLVDILAMGKESLEDIHKEAMDLEETAYTHKDSRKIFAQTARMTLDQ